MLVGAVEHDGNTQWTLFHLSWFRDIDPSDRLGGSAHSSFRVELVNHLKPLFRSDRFYSIYACGSLASVVLCHPPYCQESRRSGRASRVSGVCGLLLRSHVVRLERCAFVCGTRAAPALRQGSLFQLSLARSGGFASPWVPSYLPYYLLPLSSRSSCRR